MLRIYPLSRKNPPKRWNKYSIELEVNKKDQRYESYKIAGHQQVKNGGTHSMIGAKND